MSGKKLGEANYGDDYHGTIAARLYLEDGRVGYVEPIRVIHLCVSCHGPNVEPELLAEVRSLYPDDEATGFLLGEEDRRAGWHRAQIDRSAP